MHRGPYAVHVTRDVEVPMRDGVPMATDIYRPEQDGQVVTGPLPVILTRTPYDKDSLAEAPRWPWVFASHGYVAVTQDCRGCFASGGEVDFLWPEADDGYDTVAWIVAQPWCDGRVAMWGTSWVSWTQTAAAAAGAEGLVALVPNMSGSSAYSSSVRHGGALELRWIAWAFWHSALNRRGARRPEWIDDALNRGAPQVADWLTRLPLRRGASQLALVEPYEQWALEVASQGDYNERWAHPSVHPVAHLDRFPDDLGVLLTGGWYDSYTRGTFELFGALSAAGKGRVHALVGPWTHGQATVELSHAGDVDFGPDAALDSFLDLHLDWYDHLLRGERNQFSSWPPLRLFVMGGGAGNRTPAGRLNHGGQWRDEQEWPLARTDYQPFYLSADASLRTQPPDAAASSTTYQFNPADPVPSIGGNVSSLSDVQPLGLQLSSADYGAFGQRRYDLLVAGGFDQRERAGVFGCKPPHLPLSARADVLTFQTPPLAAATEVTGPITVALWVASTAADTDFTAKLIDVYPPGPWYPQGYALNLTDSILRLRYRDGDTEVPYQPGEIVRIEIELYPTSNLFAAGHRIRLDISSSNFPRFDVNPNTGDPLWQERRRRPCENTVFHDADHPSHVVLPVIPR
jgi:putative CocE/NonD family hydrolase